MNIKFGPYFYVMSCWRVASFLPEPEQLLLNIIHIVQGFIVLLSTYSSQ